MTTPDNALIDGQERLKKYLARLSRARGFHKEEIHCFDAGEPTEVLLRVSDIQAALDRIGSRWRMSRSVNYLMHSSGTMGHKIREL